MRIVFDTGRNFSKFLAARFIFVTVLLAVAAVFQAHRSNAAIYLALFAANAGLSLGCWEWFRRGRSGSGLRWLALSAAVCLDTLVLRFTGGADSEFLFLYFFSIGAAGLLTGLAGGVWTAALSTVGLLWLYADAPGVDVGLKVFVYAANFAVTAVLASYLFRRLSERERVHQKTLGELEQIRLDTQAILDSLSSGVLALDRAGRVLYSNPAGRTILNLARNAEVKDVEALLQADQPMGAALQARLEAGIKESRSEFSLPVDNGMRPIGLSVSPLLDTAGELRGHIVLFVDLTKAKEAERAERERERLAAIGRLSRDLAHEIRNPLATVRGCVEIIKTCEVRESEMAPYLELALRESDRLNGLLRDFLAFAHLEPPRKRTHDLLSVIRNRLEEKPAGMTVVDHLPDHMVAEFDADQLALAVDAILLSLFEWAEGQGEIRLESGPAGQSCVRFTLPNVAIPAEIKEAVQQPFSGMQRVRNGLAIPTAMRAVHAHGGQLTLDSRPGVGTWFELAI